MKPFKLYVNGILARCFMTKGMAIKYGMNFFPSYIEDSRTNKIVWNGTK